MRAHFHPFTKIPTSRWNSHSTLTLPHPGYTHTHTRDYISRRVFATTHRHPLPVDNGGQSHLAIHTSIPRPGNGPLLAPAMALVAVAVVASVVVHSRLSAMNRCQCRFGGPRRQRRLTLHGVQLSWPRASPRYIIRHHTHIPDSWPFLTPCIFVHIGHFPPELASARLNPFREDSLSTNTSPHLLITRSQRAEHKELKRKSSISLEMNRNLFHSFIKAN